MLYFPTCLTSITLFTGACNAALKYPEINPPHTSIFKWHTIAGIKYAIRAAENMPDIRISWHDSGMCVCFRLISFSVTLPDVPLATTEAARCARTHHTCGGVKAKRGDPQKSQKITKQSRKHRVQRQWLKAGVHRCSFIENTNRLWLADCGWDAWLGDKSPTGDNTCLYSTGILGKGNKMSKYSAVKRFAHF